MIDGTGEGLSLDGLQLRTVGIKDAADVNHVADQLVARIEARASPELLVLFDRLDQVQNVFRGRSRLAALVQIIATGLAAGHFVAATTDPRVELHASLTSVFGRNYRLLDHYRGIAQTPEGQEAASPAVSPPSTM